MAGHAKRLAIQVWSAFTVNGSKEPRWGKKVSAENVIKRAVVGLLGQGRVSAPTDANGKTSLDLAGIADGRYTLRFVPAAGEICEKPAGPEMVLPMTAGPKGAPMPPDRAYRVLDVVIQVKDSKLTKTPFVVPTMTHGSVLASTEDSLEVDWKPDWVRASNVQVRLKVQDVNSKSKPEPDPDLKPNAIVLHRTGKSQIGSALSEFISGVTNAHYIVDLDGHVVKMVPDLLMAGHAGTNAQWSGKTPVNAFSIGIEHVNEKGSFPPAQLASSIQLIQKLMVAFSGISRHRVLGHCEVSPLVNNSGPAAKRAPHGSDNWSNERVDCPGHAFDWLELERRYLATTPLPMVELMRPYDDFFADSPRGVIVVGDRDTGEKIRKYRTLVLMLQRDLATLGYEAALSPGVYDVQTSRLVERFQARYFSAARSPSGKPLRPEFGKLDLVTANVIRGALLDKKRP